MRFADVYAGLGGFHLALKSMGHTCVFASEIDESLEKIVQEKFRLSARRGHPHGSCFLDPWPRHLVCGISVPTVLKGRRAAGVRLSQIRRPFRSRSEDCCGAKASLRVIRKCSKLTAAQRRENLARSASGLIQAGYNIDSRYLSPHQFGIPQIRERVTLVGSRRGLDGFASPGRSRIATLSLQKILDEDPADARGRTSPRVVKCLRAWQQFIKLFRKDDDLPSFPIWSMEFGATYPFEERTPFALHIERLREFRGSHGKLLRRVPAPQVIGSAPLLRPD